MWALVRISNTQPKLTSRFQATNMNDLKEIVELVHKALSEYDFVDLRDLEKGLKEVV